jgi:hypothetical protein
MHRFLSRSAPDPAFTPSAPHARVEQWAAGGAFLIRLIWHSSSAYLAEMGTDVSRRPPLIATTGDPAEAARYKLQADARAVLQILHNNRGAWPRGK